VVEAGRVGPGELEGLVLDPADDVELVGAGRGGTAGGVQAVMDRVDEVAGRDGAVELAEVVEADRGVDGESGAGGQVAQGAVAQAAAGDGAELFLDGLECLAPAAGRDGGEGDGVDGGEPADGPGQVSAGELVFLTAVALQVDQDLVLAGPAGQHAAEGGEQHVVDLGPVSRRYLVEQGPGPVRGKRESDRPGRGDRVGAVAVRGQQGGGSAGQLLPPGELVIQAAGPGTGVQAQGPVPERGRPGTEIGRGPGGGLLAGGGQVLEQDPPGHRVDHQMMDSEQQHRPPLAAVEQDRAQQRPGGQVEAGVDPPGQLIDGGLLLAGVADPGHVTAFQQARVRRRAGRRVVLLPAAAGLGEPHPQRVMMRGQGVQRGTQDRRVGHGSQFQCHPLIKMFRPGRPGLQEPALHRGQRHRPAHRPLTSCRHSGLRGFCCQCGDGRMAEQVAGQQAEPGAAGTGGDLDGQDGVAAQLEVVVVDADLVQAQDISPDPGDRLLSRSAGGDVASGGGVPVGGGQGPPVQLPARSQRQGVQGSEARGDHVIGQGAAEPVAQVRGRRHAGRGGGDEVGGQLLAAGGVLAGDHGGTGDSGVGGQGGLDLAGLDAEAADLDLLIGAAQVLQLPGTGPAGQIPGRVHPLTGHPERARSKPLRGQARLAQVTASQPRPRDIQLPADPGRHQPQPRIQDVDLHVVQRAADRHRVGHGARLRHGVAGGERGGLGRAVPVDDGQGGAGGQHPADRGGGDHVSAGPDLPCPGQGIRRVLGQHPEQPGGQPQRSHPAPDDRLAHCGGVQVTGRCHHDRTAGQQRDPQLVGRGVESQRGVQQDPLVRAAGEAVVGGQRCHVAVPDRDCFGLAGGPRGVGDISQVLGINDDRERGGRAASQQLGRVDQHRAAIVQPGRGGLPGPVTQHHVRTGLNQELVHPPGRGPGIDGQVGGAGLEDCQDRDDLFRRPVGEDGDPVLSAHSHPGQPVC